jgi:hypothetical protein
MNLLKELSGKDFEDLIRNETITGVVIQKVTYATDANKLGAKNAFRFSVSILLRQCKPDILVSSFPFKTSSLITKVAVIHYD